MKDLVRRYVACSNNRDIEGMNALRAPGFVAHVPSQGSIGASTPINAEALNRDLLMISAAFPDLRNEIQELVAEGDRVVVRGELSGTFKSALGDVLPTGLRIAWDTVHLYRVEHDLLAEAWFVTDTLSLLRQAGAVQVLAPAPRVER